MKEVNEGVIVIQLRYKKMICGVKLIDIEVEILLHCKINQKVFVKMAMG